MVVVVVFGISHIVMCSGAARHRKGPPSQRSAIAKVRHCGQGGLYRLGLGLRVRVRVRDLCDGGPLRWRRFAMADRNPLNDLC